jgi:glycerophosphoryl diester phosphodiesterase
VRAAEDGTPVVIHDEDLARVQGVDRPVAEVSVADLAWLGVPSFAAVLEALPDSCFLDVELKEDIGIEVVPLLAAVRGDPPRNAVISSFVPDIIATVREVAPGWPCWLITGSLDQGVVNVACSLGCRGIAVEWMVLDRAGSALVRDAGLQLMAWTINQRDVLHEVAQLELDAVCLDPPALPERSQEVVSPDPWAWR